MALELRNFTLESLRIISDFEWDKDGNEKQAVQAIVKLNINCARYHEVGEGSNPKEAFLNALKKVLCRMYPKLGYIFVDSENKRHELAVESMGDFARRLEKSAISSS